VPPVAVHANEYGVRPPDPVAVQVTAVLTVPVAGQLIVTVGGTIVGLMVMLADADAVTALPSVAVTLTVNVVVVVTV